MTKTLAVYHPLPSTSGETSWATSGSPSHAVSESSHLGDWCTSLGADFGPGHCRRRKIRCAVQEGDPQGRCGNCIRLKKDCHFYPVDAQGVPESRPHAKSGAVSSNPSVMSHSPTGVGSETQEDSDREMRRYPTLPSNVSREHSIHLDPNTALSAVNSGEQGHCCRRFALTCFQYQSPHHKLVIITHRWVKLHLGTRDPSLVPQHPTPTHVRLCSGDTISLRLSIPVVLRTRPIHPSQVHSTTRLLIFKDTTSKSIKLLPGQLRMVKLRGDQPSIILRNTPNTWQALGNSHLVYTLHLILCRVMPFPRLRCRRHNTRQ